MELSDVKILALRRDGECVCGAFVPRGNQAGWHRSLRIVVCLRCLKVDQADDVVDVGVPGGSLDREHARRVAAREARVREAHPWLGGLLLKMRGTPPTTAAFAIGAAGEREAARRLQDAAGGQVLFLYNRRLSAGGRRGDIDMIAVAPSGVHVIDPKKYAGRTVRASRAGDTFVVDGRRRPGLAASMRRQIEAVRSAVERGPKPETPVSAAYCFIDADLPWSALVVDGVPALSLRGAAKLVKQDGPVDSDARAILHADLSRRFPQA